MRMFKLVWQFYLWLVLMLGLPLLAVGFQATSPLTFEDGAISITDPLPADNGGTERSTLTLYNLLVGAATAPVALIAPHATGGMPLISAGSSANPTYGALPLGTAGVVSGQLPLASGGTNKNATAVNGGIVWTDADSMEVSAAGSSGECLKSNGAAAPSFGSCTTSGAPLMAFGTMGDVSNNTVFANFTGNVDTNEVRVQMKMPAATFANLRCLASVAPGGAQTIVITGMSGTCGTQSADVDHVCTITGAATTCTQDPDTESVSTTAGQCLDYRIVSSATAVNSVVTCTVERTA